MQDLFDILQTSERTEIETAFQLLEEEKLNEAVPTFEAIVNGDYSPDAKSFANYGLGTAYLKKTVLGGFLNYSDIEKAVGYLQRTLIQLDFADARLMLGYALQNKITYLTTKTASDNQRDRELIQLVDQATAEFRRVAQLNSDFKTENEIKALEKHKRGLAKRMRKRII